MIRKTLPKKPTVASHSDQQNLTHTFLASILFYQVFLSTDKGWATYYKSNSMHTYAMRTQEIHINDACVCVYRYTYTYTSVCVCQCARARQCVCVCVYSCIQVLCLIIPVYIFPVYIECTHHDTWKYIPWMYRDDIDESRCFIVHEHLDTIFPRHHLELTPLVPTHDWAIGSSSLSERETW